MAFCVTSMYKAADLFLEACGMLDFRESLVSFLVLYIKCYAHWRRASRIGFVSVLSCILRCN